MAPAARQARIDRYEKPDRIDCALPAEPTENAEATEPTDPIDNSEPADPIERIEPADPMDRIEPLDPILRIEPAEPAADVLAGDEPADNGLRMLRMTAFSQPPHIASASGTRGKLSDGAARRGLEGFRVRATVMLSQDLTGLAGLVGDGALAYLAAQNRELSHGYGEAGITHLTVHDARSG
jgi:hypothetical protein